MRNKRKQVAARVIASVVVAAMIVTLWQNWYCSIPYKNFLGS